MSDVRSITIIGAGLVGSLASIYLARRGYDVKVFEKRPDMRDKSIDGGRSINLALSNRGWWPLKEVGLEHQVNEMVIPMQGRMMHDTSGILTFQRYGQEGQAINSISRAGLNALLMTEAERAGAEIYFNCSIEHVDFERNVIHYTEGGDKKENVTGILIGSDGAFSMVRKFMQVTDRFNYSQYYIEHGYKELTIPAGEDGRFRLEKNALHIWPRGNYMLIALPNQDASFTCTLFLPFEGARSFEQLATDADILDFFKQDFPDALEQMPALLEDFHHNPTSSLVTVKCYPWVKNKTLILGDASHAIVPFYGQGMNSGFEDCRVLNALLDEHKDNWERVLPEFQQLRKPDADAISDLALRNFIEMRDLVADENFLLRKKIEAKLQELYPGLWIPLYSMVTFQEELRYSEALRQGQRQQKIMDEVMEMPSIADRWQSLDFQAIVDELKD
ncbi:MAG: FAD-dependent monooxygenase [Cytophagales bacterium]|nr:FAD-dependent monooxygenase [Cytophagales bacterium]